MHGEIPGSFGRYGCVISHIFAGSFLEAVEDIYEGTVIPNRKFHSLIAAYYSRHFLVFSNLVFRLSNELDIGHQNAKKNQ